MINKNEIANRIKEIRISSNLSQEEFGEKLGLTRQSISALETGKNSLTIETIDKLHEIFKTDVNYLLYGEIYENSNEIEEIKNEYNNNNKNIIKKIYKDKIIIPLFCILLVSLIILISQIIYSFLNPIYYNFTFNPIFWYVFISTGESTTFLVFFIIFAILFLLSFILLIWRIIYVIKKKII